MMGRDFLKGFLHIYEHEPCLWQVKSKEYYDKDKKEAGYAKLVDKLREVEPNATKDAVLKKINNLRSAHRKEVKKIRHSIKSGAIGDDVYKPKLWYFPLLSFLGDNLRGAHSELDSDDGEAGAVEHDEHFESLEDSTDIFVGDVIEDDHNLMDPLSTAPSTRCRPSSTNASHKRLKRCSHYSSDHEGVRAKSATMYNLEEECDVIAKHVALQLRQLPTSDMLQANVEIQQVLLKYRLANLERQNREMFD